MVDEVTVWRMIAMILMIAMIVSGLPSLCFSMQNVSFAQFVQELI